MDETHSDCEGEDPYYPETDRELVYTTRSGRNVYSVKRLIVTDPNNNLDMERLEECENDPDVVEEDDEEDESEEQEEEDDDYTDQEEEEDEFETCDEEEEDDEDVTPVTSYRDVFGP